MSKERKGCFVASSSDNSITGILSHFQLLGTVQYNPWMDGWIQLKIAQVVYKVRFYSSTREDIETL